MYGSSSEACEMNTSHGSGDGSGFGRGGWVAGAPSACFDYKIEFMRPHRLFGGPDFHGVLGAVVQGEIVDHEILLTRRTLQPAQTITQMPRAPHGEKPDLNHILSLIEQTEISAFIMGHLVVEGLLVQFLEAQLGAAIEDILKTNFIQKAEACFDADLFGPAFADPANPERPP
jgi:hypothetical protein